MPGIIYQPLSRRSFLRHSSVMLGALTCAGALRPESARAQSAERPGSVRLALLSDTHIPANPAEEYRKFLPWENLRRIVPQLIDAKPEAVILNGDAARLSGELADYEELKKLLGPVAEKVPVYTALGNHDNRENFSKIFPETVATREKVSEKHVLIVETEPVRFILLDSLLYVNKVAGLLGKAQREWLATYLQGSDSKPVVLFVHHTLGDADGELLDVDRLFGIVRPARKVKAIFYGHSHEFSIREDHGVQLVNLPAVGYNFKDTEPVGWVDGRFNGQGAELTLSAFAGDQSRHGKTISIAWRT